MENMDTKLINEYGMTIPLNGEAPVNENAKENAKCAFEQAKQTLKTKKSTQQMTMLQTSEVLDLDVKIENHDFNNYYYECEVCKELFNEPINLVRHVFNIHDGVFVGMISLFRTSIIIFGHNIKKNFITKFDIFEEKLLNKSILVHIWKLYDQ